MMILTCNNLIIIKKLFPMQKKKNTKLMKFLIYYIKLELYLSKNFASNIFILKFIEISSLNTPKLYKFLNYVTYVKRRRRIIRCFILQKKIVNAKKKR
jgi:hypothetical protein